MSSICSSNAHIFYIILLRLQGYVPANLVLAYYVQGLLRVLFQLSQITVVVYPWYLPRLLKYICVVLFVQSPW